MEAASSHGALGPEHSSPSPRRGPQGEELSGPAEGGVAQPHLVLCSCVRSTCCPSGSVLGTWGLAVSHTDQPQSSGAWSLVYRRETANTTPAGLAGGSAMGKAGRAAGSGQAGLLGKVGVHPRKEGHLELL